MNTIAMDIVVLPSKDAMSEIISISKEMNSSVFTLGVDDFIPHISLCMRSLDLNDLEKLRTEIQQLAEEHLPITVEMEKIKTSQLSVGYPWTSLYLKASSKLKQLQDNILKIVEKYPKVELTKDMFVDPKDIEETGISWANNYYTNSTGEKFNPPHISIGVGELESRELHKTITFKRVEITQLGTYCTCRRIL